MVSEKRDVVDGHLDESDSCRFAKEDDRRQRVLHDFRSASCRSQSPGNSAHGRDWGDAPGDKPYVRAPLNDSRTCTDHRDAA